MLKLYKYKDRIFIRFLASYLIILLIPLIIGSLVYKKTIETIEADKLEDSILLLEQTREIMDRRLEEIDSLIVQIAFNSKDISFLTQNDLVDNPQARFKILEYYNSIIPYTFSATTNKSLFILFKKLDLVVSPESALNADEFYSTFLKPLGITNENWTDEILQRNYRKYILPSNNGAVEKQSNNIIMLQSFPLDEINNPSSLIIIFINVDEFFGALKKLIPQDKGYIWILGPDKTPIASFGNNSSQLSAPIPETEKDEQNYRNLEIDGRKMLVSTVKSRYNEWTYVAAQPRSIILSKANYVKNIIIAFALLWLLGGILAALIMARRNALPIKRIIANIKQVFDDVPGSTTNEYDFIDATLARIVEDDYSLRQTIKEQIPIIRAAFIERLVKLGFNNEEELYSNMKAARVDIKGTSFCVLAVRLSIKESEINIADESNVFKILAGNCFKEAYDRSYYIDIDEYRFAVLLALDCENHECDRIIQSIVNDAKNQMESQYGVHIICAVGRIQYSLNHSAYSFAEAIKALELSKPDSKILVWYSNIALGNDTYYFPIDMEARLINITCAGDDKEVQKLFEIIYRENFADRKISYDMTRYLLAEMKGAVIKIVERTSIEDLNFSANIKRCTESLDIESTAEEVFKAINSICILICNKINDKKVRNIFPVVDEIIGYIDKNYTEYSLSLSEVAQEFKMTENALSEYFKTHTGENFSDYVIRIRMDKASYILKNTNKTVEEISTLVGYGSSRTFRRAFKRQTGLSPSEYR